MKEFAPRRTIMNRRERVDDVNIDSDVAYIFTKMDDAIDDDKRSMINQKPALAKLKYCK